MKNLLLFAFFLCFYTVLWGKCGVKISDYHIDHKDDTQLTYYFEAELWTNSRSSVWDFGDGIIDTLQYEESTRFHTAIHKFLWPGIYHVVVYTCEGRTDEVTLIVEANQYIPPCEDEYEYRVEILEKNNELIMNLKNQMYENTVWMIEDDFFELADTFRYTVYYPDTLDFRISSRDENGYFMCRDEVALDFEVNFHADFETRLGRYSIGISFDNRSWGEEYLSFWDFGDGNTSIRKHSGHEYQDIGLYEVCLSIEDTTLQQTAYKCKEVAIDCIGDFSFELDPDYPNIVHFSFESTGLGILPTFSFSNGETIKPTKKEFTHTFSDTYLDMVVCAESPLEKCPAIYCHNIHFPIREQCEAKFQEKLIGEGEAYFIQNLSTSSNDSVSYHWSSWHYESQSKNPEYVIYRANNRNYDLVYLELTTSENCHSAEEKYLYYNSNLEDSQKPAACFTVAEIDATTYHFKNYTPDDNTTFEWDFGDAQVDTSRHATHPYDSEGFYQVCLTANKLSNGELLSQQFCEWLNIGDTDTCAALFTPINYLSTFRRDWGYVQCYNQSYPPLDTLTSYYWDFGDGSTSTDFMPTHEYAYADTFQICLNVKSSNNCESQYCREIMAGCTEDLSAIYHEDTDVLIIKDETLHYEQREYYRWYINGDYVHLGTEASLTIDELSEKYDLSSIEICLNYRNKTVCEDFCKTFHFYTDIKTVKNDKLLFSSFPNPFNQTLQIDLEEITTPLQIKILDINGKTVYSNANPSKKMTIQTESWHTGLYFIQMLTPNGISSRRVLKME